VNENLIKHNSLLGKWCPALLDGVYDKKKRRLVETPLE